MLARLIRRYPDELRADMQEVYGLNLDDLGTGYTLKHAGALAAQLPATSRVQCRIDPANAWGWTEQLLAATVNTLRVMAGIGQPVYPPGYQPRTVAAPLAARGTRGEVTMDADAYGARLALPRAEAGTTETEKSDQ